MIEIYCKTNSFEALKHTPASHKKIKFMQKQPIKIGTVIGGEKKNILIIQILIFVFHHKMNYHFQ